MEYALALTPALSPRRGGGARDVCGKATRPSIGGAFERKGNNATDGTEAVELSNGARNLSPGERAGVRASLPESERVRQST